MELLGYETLKNLRKNIPRLAELLALGQNQDIASWTHIVDTKLLARFSPDFPIVAAVCGGGSSGKSSLFNALLQERLAPTGGKAGMNRRILFSVPAQRAAESGLLSSLVEPFPAEPEQLKNTEDLTRPGNPLYVLTRTIAANIVLLDTPDFDTGARGQYVNREVTRMALEASDIFIYIFTNSNYNNRDNTDFVSRMLTGIGRRKCFLVYRVYPSFTEQEVLEHAMTVARNIYGDAAEKYLLGIYRADENNRVAAGVRFMQLKPVPGDGSDIITALGAIDTQRLRLELHASILEDVRQTCRRILEDARMSTHELQLYLDAFQTAQSHTVHEALKHFPMDRVLKRFARIWSDGDPVHIKVMRKTGRLIELPLKAAFGAAGWIKDQLAAPNAARESADDFQKTLDEDLTAAVTGMYLQIAGPQISVRAAITDPVARRMFETTNRIKAIKNLSQTENPKAEASDQNSLFNFSVPCHPAVIPAQQRLRNKDFKSILQAIFAHKGELVDISLDMDRDLTDLAENFRRKMDLWTKISQTFWASLSVLPATVAVTYVLSTGDPVGATGIKVKLSGLIGAKDLYALFAIPVTTGMKRADQKQLEAMLGPIAKSWFNHKLKKVQDLFEQHMTGDIIQTSQAILAEAAHLIAEIEKGLEDSEAAMRPT